MTGSLLEVSDFQWHVLSDGRQSQMEEKINFVHSGVRLCGTAVSSLPRGYPPGGETSRWYPQP